MKSYFKNRIVFALLVATTCISNVEAQNEHPKVRIVIDQLFEGMRTGDSAMVSHSVLPTATLQTTMKGQGGKITTEGGRIADFLKAVGTPHKDTWDEQIYDVVIQVDGPMATVWAPYKFYRGTAFSHCGVNAFSLIDTMDGWKISAITDTRRKEDCL